MWYVGPDGTVYEHLPDSGNCYTSPDFVDLRECNPIHINDQQKSPLDSIMKMRETEARIKQEEAKASYWKAKAENERRKNSPLHGGDFWP